MGKIHCVGFKKSQIRINRAFSLVYETHPLRLAGARDGGSGVPYVLAHRSSGGDSSVWPRVVATVIALAPRGMATIRASDETTYDVIQGTTWRVGDTVECEQHPRVRMPWQAFECWEIS